MPVTQVQSLRYWFDDDSVNIQTSGTLSGTFMMDVSELSDGVHTLHYQAVGADGQCYGLASQLFLKVMNSLAAPGQEAAVAAAKLQYWYDNDTENMQVASGLTGTYSLDVSAHADGIHTIHYQVMSADGTIYDESSSMFIKISNEFVDSSVETEANASYLQYWFDGDSEMKQNVSGMSGAYSLDVSALGGGVHTLYYQIVYDDGNVSPTAASLLLKDFEIPTKVDNNAVTQYQYWLNDNGKTPLTVEVTNAANPYVLYALLPMQKQPLRSSSFHFEVTDGVPTIYARNELHVRFHDKQGYFVDGVQSFNDFNVNQEVMPVGEIQGTQTFAKVTENDILWYTVPALPGDSVAFRLSQPGTVQFFSPSGQELFKSSEAGSMQFGGTHTWEEGTYYLAVHDVTGTRPTMTLDFIHLDKYDVVDWDVHTVGNGGCSTITFKGNGFRDLYAVELYTATGDTIHSIDISHNSDAEIKVAFDFNSAEMGDYEAVFHFTEEDKQMVNIVSVEEAVGIELTTDVSYPSAFLRGTSTTYTVKITNKGNMTAYDVPIYTWLKSRTADEIYNIHYEGLELPKLLDGISTDSLTTDELDELMARVSAIGDDHCFLGFWAEDAEHPGDSVFIRSNYFFTDIAPKETLTLRLSVSANEGDVVAYFTVPKDWPSYELRGTSYNSHDAKARLRRARWVEEYCCMRGKVECISSLFADATGIASKIAEKIAPGTPTDVALGIASCLADCFNQVLSATGKVMCGDNSGEDKGFLETVKSISNGVSIASTLTSCAEKLLPASKLKNFLKSLSELLEGKGLLTALGIGADLNSCIHAFTDPVPGCPPNPNVRGGISTPLASLDPNDIFGYLSDAGTHFIADSVERVAYTIEFENDTTLATAAAHTIVVRDTLDSRFFDLKSFLPTRVRVGAQEAFLDETEDVKTAAGMTRFVKTLDMRPEINAIAQVEGEYCQQTGIAEWRFTSLDPMTMEPTDDVMQGILPVNYDGTSGIGEVMFEVGVRTGKEDGAQLANRAGIVFDYEEAILTPTWVNTVDAVAPTSAILGGIQRTDSTLTLRLAGEDERSGVWKYDVYAQMGQGTSWERVAENVTDTLCDVRIYDGIEYGFLVLATDSAGNVERKSFEEADFRLTTVTPGDANGDGTVDALDVILVTSYYLGNDVFLNLAAGDVNADGEVNSLDVIAIQNIYLNATSGGRALAPRRRKMRN